MNRIKHLIFSITLQMLSLACFAQVPTITDFTPKSGVVGTTVTISGSNFSSTISSNIVYFGATKATVTAASTTQLTVTVPAGATYDPIVVISNGLAGFSSEPFIVTFLSPGVINSSAFAAKVDFITGSQPMGIAAGDLDGDGKVDLVCADYNSNQVSILRNISSVGTISFATKVDIAVGAKPIGVAIGDVDNDGKLDIAVTNWNDNSVMVLKNNSTAGSISSGSFTTFTYSTGNNPVGVAIHDLDGDGRSELIVANSNPNTVGVFRNTSTAAPSFAGRVDYSTGNAPFGLAIGDLDSDGKPEILAANSGNNTVSVLKNASIAGTINLASFAAKTDYSTGGASSVAVGDLDGDGKLDIITANNGSTTISLLRNVAVPSVIASNSFSNKVDITGGTNPNGISLADINGDGKPDMVTVASNPFVSVYSNAMAASGAFTAGSFSSRVDFVPGSGPYDNAIADLDGDGRMDLAVTSQVGNVISAFRSIIDYSPPFVSSNTTSPSVAPATDIVVSANLVDDISGIATAKIQYRAVAGSAAFVTADLVHGALSSYSYTIPASTMSDTELGIEYKFLLTDVAGNSNQGAQTYYNVVINHSADNSNQGLEVTSYIGANGENQNNYRIISIPLELNNKTADDVFKDVIGNYDPTVWRMFHYNGTTNVELSGTSVVVPGEGYWFIATPSSPLYTGGGTTVNVNSNSPFTITLRPGWTQLGNPYNFNISWADILLANPSLIGFLGGNTSKIRTYRGSDLLSDQDRDVIKVTEGGFVKNTNTSPITIKIPVTKNSGAQSGRQSTVSSKMTNSLDQTDWEVLFNLKSGTTEYSFGGFGMRHDANVGFDYYDDYNLPRFLEYLEIKYPKERVGMTYTKDIVPTAENYVWSFAVESNMQEAITTLEWDNSYFGGGREIYLLDVATHRITDMNVNSHYNFSRSTSKDFKVVFGNSDFVKKELTPSAAVLYDPYPNPFTDKIAIEYALPEEVAGVGGEISIYNSAGVKISSAMTQTESGSGRWIWDSENQASGLYFVKLIVGNRYVTKKILKH